MDELDFYTKAEIEEMFDLPESEDKTLDFYTKAEIREKVGTPETIVIDENEMLLDFYVKAEIDSIPTSPIPSDYTQIEWIQATGTQYIDTGYTQQSSALRIEMEVEVNGGSNGACIFHAPNVWAQIGWSSVVHFYSFRVYRNGTRDLVGDLHDPYGVEANFVVVVDMSPNGETLTEAGVVKSTASGHDVSVGATSSYWIFAKNTGSGAGDFIQAKLRSFKLYDGGQLVRDLTPVIRNADSKPGLWDMIGKQFYTNAGTGEFEIPT